MNLQDILMKLQSYHVGCRVEDGNFLITLIYNDGWKIIPPENNKIDFGQEKDITYYAAAINEVSFDEVFMSIKETIDYNIDLQRKVTLYKAKVDELQEIFANESLEKLRTITFVFDEKKKPKRKYVRKNVKQCVDKNSDDDIKDNPIESETAIVNDRKETESELKIDNRDDEEYIGDDGIGYQEYTGEDMPDDEENKVDYLEQLKNQ